MKTQLRELVKHSLTDAFIVTEEITAPEKDEWAAMTWYEAGQLSSTLAFVGLIMFGLHFLAYGQSEGMPPRDLLVKSFSIGMAILGMHQIQAWRIRIRFLAAYTSALAVVGLFLRFVVQDPVTFSPLHLVAQLAILVLIGIGFDVYRARRVTSERDRA